MKSLNSIVQNVESETYVGDDSRIPIVRIRPKGSVKRCPPVEKQEMFSTQIQAICLCYVSHRQGSASGRYRREYQGHFY